MDSIVVGAIIAGIFGVIGIVAGVVITIQAQNRQIRLSREQTIQDDRRARLRQYFATIYRVASFQIYAFERMKIVTYSASVNNEPDFYTKKEIDLLDEFVRVNIEAQEIIAILRLEGITSH